jgi:hypothetical protein
LAERSLGIITFEEPCSFDLSSRCHHHQERLSSRSRKLQSSRTDALHLIGSVLPPWSWEPRIRGSWPSWFLAPTVLHVLPRAAPLMPFRSRSEFGPKSCVRAIRCQEPSHSRTALPWSFLLHDAFGMR